MDPTIVVNELASELSNVLGSTVLLQKLFLSGVLILLLWFARKFAVRLLNKQNLEAEARYRWTKIINYAVTIIGIFTVGAVWWSFIGSLATILAVILAGLAIALREPITNVAGWAFIMWRRPFVLGDRIEMAGVKGDVADINWFTFSLLEIGGMDMGRQPTGRVVHMPNSWVFSKYTANETQKFGFVWHEIPVVITFESNWRKAESLLCEIAEKQAGELTPAAKAALQKAATHLLFSSSDRVEPNVYVRVIDIGVELTLRLVTAARKRREVEQSVWKKVLDAFAQEPDIDFAYPTQRIYLNPQEGKSGAGGPPRSD
jgi:small-conductance mechanosensitive channel